MVKNAMVFSAIVYTHRGHLSQSLRNLNSRTKFDFEKTQYVAIVKISLRELNEREITGGLTNIPIFTPSNLFLILILLKKK